MSLKKLLEGINEEVNESKVRVKEPKERMLFERIAREVLDDRVDEVDLAALAQKVKPTLQKASGAIKKVGTAVKGGWMKLKNHIKEVGKWGFRFGVAVGKTFAGRFTAFNPAGKMLIPEAEAFKTTKFRDHTFMTFTYKTKSGPMDITLADDLSNGVGTMVYKDLGVLYVIAPKGKTVVEGIDYPKPLLEAAAPADPDEEEETEEKPSEIETGVRGVSGKTLETIYKMEQQVFSSFQSKEAQEALNWSREQRPTSEPTEVNTEQFISKLSGILKRVGAKKVGEKSTVKSVAIWAPSGWGKSEIISALSEEPEFKYGVVKIELSKVDINLISGFPYLDEYELEKLSKEEKLDRAKKIAKMVRLAPSSVLPRGSGNWVLFLDEFNRAEMDKTSAIMNLMLTGELGGAAELTASGKIAEGAYKLPEQTVVILAMNTGTQGDTTEAINAVHDLDIATTRRLLWKFTGKLSAPSWYDTFAGLPYITKLKSGDTIASKYRVPSIIMNYVISKMKGDSTKENEIDVEAPFKEVLKAGEGVGKGGGEFFTDPATLTRLGDEMFEIAYSDWESLSDESRAKWRKPGQELKSEMEKQWPKIKKMRAIPWKKNDLPDELEPYMFGAWFNDLPQQERTLAQTSGILGREGEKIVNSMMMNFRKKGATGITIEDFMFNYPHLRGEKGKLIKGRWTSFGFGSKPMMLAKMVFALYQFRSEEDAKEFMDKRSIPLIKGKSGQPVPLYSHLFNTFYAMTEDLKLSAEDMIGFCRMLHDKANKDRAAKKTSFITGLDAVLQRDWELYSKAIVMSQKTKSQVEKEFKKLTGEGEEEGEEKKEEEILLFLKKMGRLE